MFPFPLVSPACTAQTLLPVLVLVALAHAPDALGESLGIATGFLPAGVPGEPYSAVLEAAGGTPPYAWSAANGVWLEFADESTFAESGTAQGWREDDECWRIDLPFEFPFFGTNYGFAWVDSNGRIAFGDEVASYSDCDTYSFWEQRVIAVMWDDLRTTGDGCDIFVSSNEVSVTVRWAAEYAYDSNDPVNASATLFEDGRVVLAFGHGNAQGGAVGFSAGDGETHKNAQEPQNGWGGAPDVTFRAPQAPAARPLPPGISLSPDGTLCGTCRTPGHYSVDFTVSDAAGEHATKTVGISFPAPPLKIATETLPEGEMWRPYSAKLEATGGLEPYLWHWSRVSTPSFRSSSSFTETGTAQGWRGDSGSWNLKLPFPFPYFGKIYTNAWIAPNGEITLGDPDSRHDSFEFDEQLEVPMICALSGRLGTAADGCDIFVASNHNSVTIRWAARFDSHDEDDPPANFSATLSQSGEIVLAYGEVDGDQGSVSFTAGDGRTGVYAAMPDGGWGNAPDVWFQAPVPPGIEIGWDGTVSGTPVLCENFEFFVTLVDAMGSTARKRVSLPVAKGPLAIVADSELPDGTTGEWYQALFRIAGGTGSYEYWIEGLPDFLGESTGEDNGLIMVDGFPDAGCGGTYSFSVRARDDAGATAERRFTIRIAENANQPPEIVSASPGTNDLVRVAEGGAVDFLVSAADPDGDELTYTWSVRADWGSSGITNSTGGGAYRLAPRNGGPNLLYVLCLVKDGVWTRRVQWTVFVGELRDLTITTGTALQDRVEGERGFKEKLASDGGAGKIAWSLVSSTLPGGEIYVDEFFQEMHIGFASHPGDWEITVEAADRFGRTARKTFTLHIDPGERTTESPVPVPHWWIDYFAADALRNNGGDYEATAISEARNGNGKIWECFLAGLAPGFSNNSSWSRRQFRADIRLDGETPVVKWNPDLGPARTYTMEGNDGLSPEGWHSPTNANDRFFRVQVSLPDLTNP